MLAPECSLCSQSFKVSRRAKQKVLEVTVAENKKQQAAGQVAKLAEPCPHLLRGWQVFCFQLLLETLFV